MRNRLKALLDKASQDLKDLWNQDKAFVILFGLLIAFLKFRDILLSILINSAKRVEQQSQAKDSKLVAQENKANDQANQLAQEAQDLPKTEKPVGEDWNEKK